MSHNKTTRSRSTWIAALLALSALLSTTGCQVEMAGQTLPSPYYLTDDVQYYAPGPSFVLAREAAAQKEQAEAQESDPQTYGR
jgi:hypothetical protein